jgi:rRNA maturation protein Rpf1
MLYVLRHDFLFEFKICHGVMLLIYEYINREEGNQPQNSVMPMSIINVHNGKPIRTVFYQHHEQNELEFLEWYNEKILVKYKDAPLEIKYVLEENRSIKVNSFTTPEAFVFIYEREIFLTLNDGKIILYDSDGRLISNFGDQVVYSKE